MTTGQRCGYIRVSTVEQNTERQLDGIQVDKTYTDRASGKNTDRPKLAELLDYVRDGDTVVVHSMDRLARDLGDLRDLVAGLTERGVCVEFVKEHLTFAPGAVNPMAQLMLNVMGAVAEFERALIRERQREGIAKAKDRGVYTGRKHALTPERAVELRRRAAAGEKKAALAREFNISRDTVYAYLDADPAAALPEDRRELPDVAVYDQLLTRAPDPVPAPQDQDITPEVADEEPPVAAPRRQRQRTPTRALIPDQVTTERDPDGGYRVSDPEDGYLGRIDRQVKVSGGRGRWQARDATGHLITDRGPWNTKDDAVIGLLLERMDRQYRSQRHS